MSHVRLFNKFQLKSKNNFIKNTNTEEKEFFRIYKILFNNIRNPNTPLSIRKDIWNILSITIKLKEDPANNIYELINVLTVVKEAFNSWKHLQSDCTNERYKKIYNKKILKLNILSDEVSGKPSFKWKMLGVATMTLALGFIVTGALIIILSAVNIIPSAGSSIFISLFGFSPIATGCGLFKKGFDLFKSGQRSGLSKNVKSLGDTMNGDLNFFSKANQHRPKFVLVVNHRNILKNK